MVEPFTADDVVFTWQWIADPANNSINIKTYQAISNVEAIDPNTVKVTFAAPTLGWNVPFCGTYLGSIYPKHVLEAGADAYDAFIQNPVGTGPYKVESFTANDQVVYVHERQLPRGEQAVLPEGQPQGRRRLHFGRAGRPADRRLGLCLEPPDRAADPPAARGQWQRHGQGQPVLERRADRCSTSRTRTRK